ncbi:MAG TPA: hypothetical protein VGN36_03745 [Sphingorhabdus sp.]|jgi:hypothetical protein|nr:hypothetical protein [Sphingorhabdus sp.]
MPGELKFPSSVEIKRVIAAAERAGIRISSIEIHPRKVIIFAVKPTDEVPKELTYSEWKAAQRTLQSSSSRRNDS